MATITTRNVVRVLPKFLKNSKISCDAVDQRFIVVNNSLILIPISIIDLRLKLKNRFGRYCDLDFNIDLMILVCNILRVFFNFRLKFSSE